MTLATYKQLLEELGPNVKDVKYSLRKQKWILVYREGTLDDEEFDTFSQLIDFVVNDAS